MTETLITHRCNLCKQTYCNPDREVCDCGHGLVEYEVKVE